MSFRLGRLPPFLAWVSLCCLLLNFAKHCQLIAWHTPEMSCAKASAYKVRKLQLKEFICSVQTCKNQSLSRDKLKGQSVMHLTLLACLCIFHRDWENPKRAVRLQPASQGPGHQSHRDHLWVSQGVSCIFHSISCSLHFCGESFVSAWKALRGQVLRRCKIGVISCW